MDLSTVSLCVMLEFTVIVLQVFGIVALCMCRLTPSRRWAERARFVFMAALIGLGIAGALCGRNDSVFGLFAGGTMTILFIGMILGSTSTEPTIATGSQTSV